MFGFIDKLFGKKESDDFKRVTVEELKQFRRFVLEKGWIQSEPEEFLQFKNLLFLDDVVGYPEETKNLNTQVIPDGVEAKKPFIGYLGLYDGDIVYFYTEDVLVTPFQCFETHRLNEIKVLCEVFQHFYDKYQVGNEVNVPKSSIENSQPKPVAPENSLAFFDDFLALEHDDEREMAYDRLYYSDGIMMVVDWREEDTEIVHQCEKIINTSQLSTEIVSNDSELGADIFIIYQGQKHKIPHEPNCAFRDITLKTLNRIIQPEYEIRWWLASDGNDTLEFLPMRKEDWVYLDGKYPEIDQHFAKISDDSTIFG